MRIALVAEDYYPQLGGVPEHVHNLALQLNRWGHPTTVVTSHMGEHPDADSILLPSPHWPTAEAIDALEREFGVNVMAAHQAIVWDALRRCGVDDRIAGFGRLFREF